MNTRFILIIACFVSSIIFSGCATIKDIPKGLAGVSTRVLEEKRPEALKQTFDLPYDECYASVKKILIQYEDKNIENKVEPYIYAEDVKKKMIAIYLSEFDTTPVGIFFTEETKSRTMIEISSASIYAKEEIAKKIFDSLNQLLKTKEDKESNVKKEIGN